MTLVTVFGGTGFLGRRIMERLIRDGDTVRIAVRNVERADALAKSVGISQAIPIAADARDPITVATAVAGSQGVVNAVSAYVEKGDVTYTNVHVQGAGTIAEACQRQNVARLVHISGIGADPASRSTYIQARGRGELAVQRAFPAATILRPGVMFAVDGGLLRILEKVAESAPLIPLIGIGTTRLQPVHAEDVAEAAYRSLRSAGSAGETYELGGPETYTMREIYNMILAHMGRSRRFLPVPFVLVSPLVRVLELLPGAPLTAAQVDLLREDNVVRAGMRGFAEFNIIPKALRDTIIHLRGDPPASGGGSS